MSWNKNIFCSSARPTRPGSRGPVRAPRHALVSRDATQQRPGAPAGSWRPISIRAARPHPHARSAAEASERGLPSPPVSSYAARALTPTHGQLPERARPAAVRSATPRAHSNAILLSSQTRGSAARVKGPLVSRAPVRLARSSCGCGWGAGPPVLLGHLTVPSGRRSVRAATGQLLLLYYTIPV